MKRILLKLILALGLLVAAVLIFFTVAEYKPAPEEPVIIAGQGTKQPKPGDSFNVLTMNTGFGALDATRDFFMDGGSVGSSETKEAVQVNVAGMNGVIAEAEADVVFLQEVDVKAKRSFGVDQVAEYSRAYGGASAFARNLKAVFIPLPLNDPLGQVDSGVQTLTQFETVNARRISLPTAYKWPVRTCQLKRCIMPQEVVMEGTDKKLILINVHMDAYASGELKTAQTKILHDLVISEYEKGNYVIVGGDFNQTIPGTDLSLYPVLNDEYFQAPEIETDGLPEGYRYVCDDSVPTSRLLNEVYSYDWAATQLYVIDGFLVSPNVQVNSVETLNEEFEYTDHNPVLMNVTLLAE